MLMNINQSKLVPLVTFALALAPATAAQKIPPPPERLHPLNPAEVAQEVRDYRMNNEDRIIRELSEFLAIPNVAADTANIQKNAAHLVEMLEARGIETHLLSITGRGPVVFGKLNAPNAQHTVIFYAHYDGQPVDPAAWTASPPFEPTLFTGPFESGAKPIPFPHDNPQHPANYNDDWRIYASLLVRRQIPHRRAPGRSRRHARQKNPASREPEINPRR